MRGPGSMFYYLCYKFSSAVHCHRSTVVERRTDLLTKFSVENQQFSGQIRDLGHNIDENFDWMAKVHSNLPAEPIFGL